MAKGSPDTIGPCTLNSRKLSKLYWEATNRTLGANVNEEGHERTMTGVVEKPAK
jgi:hypothetical protein